MVIKQGLVIGVANLIVGLIIMFGSSMLLPSYAQEMMTSFAIRALKDPLMMLFFLSPFVSGFAFAYFWSLFGKQIKGKTQKERALEFTKFYFLFATIPGMFITFTTFRVSPLLILVWTIQGVVQSFLAGYILARK